jgi:hypothetical protein
MFEFRLPHQSCCLVWRMPGDRTLALFWKFSINARYIEKMDLHKRWHPFAGIQRLEIGVVTKRLLLGLSPDARLL